MSSSLSSSSVSSSSSKKVSSSSVSSSTKIASSSALSSGSSLLSSSRGRELSSDVDDLLAASLSARESARDIASGMSDRSARTAIGDLDIDDMMKGSSIGSGSNAATKSTSSSTSSSSKKATKISSISQSSLEMGDGVEGGVKSSMKSHTQSLASSAVLATKQASIDGEVVLSETIGEKASRAAESGKEKVIEGGQVVKDTGFKMEQTSHGQLRATKEMSQKELDEFFKQKNITDKPVESLNYDKDSNVFEVKLKDLPEFSPQELTVKIVDDVIVVVGSHVEKIDEHNYKTHEYIRRFTVPKELKSDNVGWSLEPSGILAIKAGESVKGGFSECHLNCTIFKPRSFFKKSTE